MFGYKNSGNVVVGTCPQCGADLFGNEVFCTQCGFDLGGAPQSDQAPAVVGYCSNVNCQQPVYEGDIYCTYCGADLAMYPPQPIGGSGPIGGNSGASTDVGVASDDGKPTIVSPGPDGIAEDDAVTARPMMVRITREEARMGCRKTIEVDGRRVAVDIPPGVGIYSKLDIPNLGYFDEMTGVQGPLRLSFRIV